MDLQCKGVFCRGKKKRRKEGKGRKKEEWKRKYLLKERINEGKDGINEK